MSNTGSVNIKGVEVEEPIHEDLEGQKMCI